MEEINFRQLCKNLKKRGYEHAEKGVSDFVEEYEKIVFSVEPKNMRLKDIVNKMKDLSDHTRAVWIDGILREFGNGFGSEKWREGYEQGKFEASMIPCDEPQKPVVPQYIAEWIGYCKLREISLAHALYRSDESVDKRVFRWVVDSLENQETFAKAWLFGYEVEKEKRYTVKTKNIIIDSSYLKRQLQDNHWYWGNSTESNALSVSHTRKELEDAGFGWIFSCEGIEVEEVE